MVKGNQRSPIRRTARSGKRPGLRCGLCGKTRKLIRTECCDHWICNDEDKYVLFSYTTNSCSRNHRRYTICGYHSTERHAGDWRDCRRCRRDIVTEMYVYYATNEYNFVKLENPPSYSPTRCTKCRTVIRLADDAYTLKGTCYWCERCSPMLWS
jgi:hypothetical protein